MTRLHPSISSIERGYRHWLGLDAGVGADSRPASSDESAPDLNQDKVMPPQWIADLIQRHVAARPKQARPATGDLVVLSREASDESVDDGLPLLMLLDEQRRGHWFGWLVGAHPDYAGSQDLVLESALLTDQRDPAPLAGMVQTWNRIHLELDSSVPVLHRLTDEAMAAVREMAVSGIEDDVAPRPGRMHLRQVAGISVITGTPYGKHDPRDDYLLLCRELAEMASQPLLEREDREYGDGEPDY